MPSCPADRITVDEVEQTLAGDVRGMRFPAAIEARFEADTGRARCRYLIAASLIGIAFYDLYLFADYRMLPDVFAAALAVKLGVVTPAVLLGALLLARNPPAWLRESTQAGLNVLHSAGILLLAMMSGSALVVYAHYPAMIGAVFATVILRLRFWYACAASACLLVNYAIAAAQLRAFPIDAYIGAVMMLVVLVICTLFANYSLERGQRRAYLAELRDKIRSGHLALANQELNRISNLDSVTGLTSRRGFDQSVEELWVDARDAGRSIAVLMLDVDYFKRFNDRYGHQAGDSCLNEVAEIARAQLRRGELIARFGGEEFVVALAGADLVDGIRTAERIRLAVETHGMRNEAVPLKIVTVSIGVAAAPATRESSPQAVIEAADAALYEAKNRGRNRVWPPLVSSEVELRSAMLSSARNSSGFPYVA